MLFKLPRLLFNVKPFIWWTEMSEFFNYNCESYLSNIKKLLAVCEIVFFINKHPIHHWYFFLIRDVKMAKSQRNHRSMDVFVCRQPDPSKYYGCLGQQEIGFRFKTLGNFLRLFSMDFIEKNILLRQSTLVEFVSNKKTKLKNDTIPEFKLPVK